jgi:2-dehydro-3-deoxyglucarate aldolase/4-hydroxy-2-oxoheptanedioate aldolase
MTSQTLRSLLRSDKLTVGTGVFEFDTPGIGQILKATGIDFAFIDMEHSCFGFETLKKMLRYAQAAELPVVVRPPTKDSHHLGLALDAGADALLVPRIETAAEARAAIAAMKYPPKGVRGAAIGIAHDRYKPTAVRETFQSANESTGAIMLIESMKGVEHADEIASVADVDGLWLGGLDLSCDMGIPGQSDGNAEFKAAADKVLSACQTHSINPGRLVFSPEEGIALYRRGFRAISYSADIYILQRALQKGVAEIREGAVP